MTAKTTNKVKALEWFVKLSMPDRESMAKKHRFDPRHLCGKLITQMWLKEKQGEQGTMNL